MQYIDETLAELTKARQRFDSVAVGYSGGKDSLAVMDLCVRTFARVEAFMMEFVPGLTLSEAALAFCRQRWGIECRRYMHWSAIQALAQGAFCDARWMNKVPKVTVTDVYNQVRRDTGIQAIATGHKRADSLSRRSIMGWTKSDDMIWPLAGWTKDHVVGYLKIRGIPLPDSVGITSSGVDLKVASMLWLHDKHPGDWAKLCNLFPYAPAVVARRTFYGIGTYAEGKEAQRPRAKDRDREVRDDGGPPVADQ